MNQGLSLALISIGPTFELVSPQLPSRADEEKRPIETAATL